MTHAESLSRLAAWAKHGTKCCGGVPPPGINELTARAAYAHGLAAVRLIHYTRHPGFALSEIEAIRESRLAFRAACDAVRRQGCAVNRHLSGKRLSAALQAAGYPVEVYRHRGGYCTLYDLAGNQLGESVYVYGAARLTVGHWIAEAEARGVLGPCRWFLKCTNPATGTTPHPTLGPVPTCDRCHKFATGGAL